MANGGEEHYERRKRGWKWRIACEEGKKWMRASAAAAAVPIPTQKAAT
jgi:hypothetical protein